MIRVVPQLTVCFFLIAVGICDGAKILGVIPFQSASHSMVIMPILEELARRGHDVTTLGFHQPDHPLENYRTVLLNPLPGMPLKGYLSLENFSNQGYLSSVLRKGERVLWNDKLIEANRAQFEEVSNEKYDVVIVEWMESDLYLGFTGKLGCPSILIHTTESFPWQRHTLADPLAPSVIPNMFVPRKSEVMGFVDRLWNTLEILQVMLIYSATMMKNAQFVAENNFGQLPPLESFAKNSSVYFTHTHHSLHGARPVNPSTIEIGGISISPIKPLPKDLKSLMDNATNGIIYFSMGSMLKGSSINSEKRDAILKVFSELDQTVLWKYEGDLPNKPTNVHSSPWLPQRDIFAHPKVVLAMGHCGLLGTYEAITEGLPMICFPIYGDQFYNAALLERKKMGIGLDYDNFSEAKLREAITRVLTDPTFKEYAEKVSAAFLDRPMSPLDTAVYWTEYVIRHKGAPHLKSPARYMQWWESYNVDVIAFLLIVAAFLVFAAYKIVKFVLTFMFCRKSHVKVKTN